MEMNQFDEQLFLFILKHNLIYCSNVWPNHEVLWASGQCLDFDGYFGGTTTAFFWSNVAVYGLPAGFGKTNLCLMVGSKK